MLALVSAAAGLAGSQMDVSQNSSYLAVDESKWGVGVSEKAYDPSHEFMNKKA